MFWRSAAVASLLTLSGAAVWWPFSVQADVTSHEALVCRSDGSHNFNQVMMDRDATLAVRAICSMFGPGRYPTVTLTVDLSYPSDRFVKYVYTTLVGYAEHEVVVTRKLPEVKTHAPTKPRKSNPQGEPSDNGGSPDDNDDGSPGDGTGEGPPDNGGPGGPPPTTPGGGNGGNPGNGGGPGCDNGIGNGGDGCTPGNSDGTPGGGQDD